MKWDNLGKYPGLPHEAFWTIGKVASAAIAVTYAVVAGVWFGPADALEVAASSAMALLCIWTPEIMAEYKGWGSVQGRPILKSSPAKLVYYGGWLLLLLPLAQILIIVWRTTP